jgi:phosphoribosylglycinamide formyltransferase-1
MWTKRSSLVVLISGNGSNLQAIIDAISKKKINCYIACVISNEEDALGLKRAQKANIKTTILNHTLYNSREEFEVDLAKEISLFSPDLIVLAGFMRILGQKFVKQFSEKIINIHPSLLPKYPGLNTHEKVIESGDKNHGVTVHYVNENLDGGPICAQSIIKVTTSNPIELKNRIHQIEYKIYPEVIGWITSGDMTIENNKITYKNKPLKNKAIFFQE